MRPTRNPSLPFAAIAAALAMASCQLLEPSEKPPWERDYELISFSALGDTAIAVRLRTFEKRRAAEDDGYDIRYMKAGYAILDRKRHDIVRAGPPFPRSAAHDLPELFFACDQGAPATLPAPGLKGEAKSCAYLSGAIGDGEGIYGIFTDTLGGLFVLDRTLGRIGAFPNSPTGWWGFSELDARAGTLSVYQGIRYTSAYNWVRHRLDGSAPPDTVVLTSPTLIKIAAGGTRFLCSEGDKDLAPCWKAEDLPGPAAALRHACYSECEWEPESRVLVSRLGNGRFLYFDPATEETQDFDADALLKSFRL